MLSKLRSRLTYANVVASIALFIALGGTSYGLATGSIGSREIKNNSVRSKDLRNNNVRGKDIRTGTVTGSDLKNDRVTGDDILESSLGGVPSAANAANATNAANASNADKLDDLDSTELSPAAGASRTDNVVLSEGAGDQTVLSANITSPRSGALLVSAAIHLTEAEASNVRVTCSLRFDGSTSSVDYTTDINNQTTLAVVWAQGVGAGAHTVELRCRGVLVNSTVDNAGMTVSAHL